jgi:predicted dehydrogenase
MPAYTAVLVGCGPRGEQHASGLTALPDRFRLSAVCDVDPARAGALAARLHVPRVYSDAGSMLAAERPDVFCFATPPAIRWPLVELGVRHGVRAIAYEKPMALTLAEARRITDLCAAAGVKTVVCHQLRHGTQWQEAKALVAGDAIGEVHTLHATGRPSMLRVGSHLVDFLLWLNGDHRAAWVLGQVDGVAAFQEDHPCPDHVMGVIHFASGARGILEVGTLAPLRLEASRFWEDAGVTVYGSHGYVRVGLGDGWQAVTRDSAGALLTGPADPAPQETAHFRALADWLDDPTRVHPANGEIAYHGFEILIALALSSLERRRVDLPLVPVPAESVLARLEKALSA